MVSHPLNELKWAVVREYLHWLSAEVHAKHPDSKDESQSLLLDGRLSLLVTVQLFTVKTDRVFNTIDYLEQGRADSYL